MDKIYSVNSTSRYSLAAIFNYEISEALFCCKTGLSSGSNTDGIEEQKLHTKTTAFWSFFSQSWKINYKVALDCCSLNLKKQNYWTVFFFRKSCKHFSPWRNEACPMHFPNDLQMSALFSIMRLGLPVCRSACLSVCLPTSPAWD